jgi:hypothetical protein
MSMLLEMLRLLRQQELRLQLLEMFLHAPGD